MTVQVLINSVDYTARLLKEGGPIIHKNDVDTFGSINANDAAFDLDNSDDNWTINNIDALEDLPVVIKINGVTQFTGFVDRPVLSVSKKRLTIKALDGFKFLNKKKCLDYVFVNTSLSDILEWLISDCGGISSYNIEDPSRTVAYAAFSLTDNLKAKLQEAVDSVGGSLWFDEAGTLQFKAGFASVFSSSTVGSLTVSDLKDIQDLKWLPSEANKIVVTGRSKTIKTKKEPVFTWSGVVPPEGWPDLKDENGDALPNEEWKALFDTPVHPDYVDEFADVEFEADSGLSLNETKYNSNFDTGRLKYPDHMFLQIDNSTAYDKNVSKLVIKARKVVETEYSATVQTGAGDIEKTISNSFISGENWASALGNWLIEEWNGKFECTIPMSDFEKGLSWKVGDKVNITETSSGLSHRALIRKIDIDYSKSSMTFTLRSDRASAFTYTNAPGTKAIESNTPDDPVVGDGVAPATPTGLDVTSFYNNGKAYIKADWDDNSESDIMGYELRWSYDESTWYNAGFTSQSELVVEVTDRSNTTTSYTVYAQVKALDVESLASDWSASDSVTVQVDTTAPNPINLITASGGVGLIRVWWTESSDPDFSYYRLERNIEYAPGLWSGWGTVADPSSNEYLDEDVDYHIQNSPEDSEYPNVWRRYKYRARAVDKAGNVSAVSVATLGETAATYALQATGGDIAVESIIANHINAVLDLSVGRQITVGSGVAIGKDVGEVGSEFDGIYVSDGTNYVKMSASSIELKANLILAAGDNYIKFVDADITIKDGDTSSGTGYLYFERDSDTFAKLYSSATDSRFRMDVEENYVSLGVAYSDSTDSNNSVSLAFQVKSTSKTNAFAGSMSLVRLGSSTEYGYFRFTAPLNILYDTGQDAADMPQGTILIQGNDLFFRDNSGASGVWKKVSASLSTPS